MEKMHYRRMDEGTDEDFAVLRHVHEQTLRAVPDRLFAMLGELKPGHRLQHHALRSLPAGRHARVARQQGRRIRRGGAAARRL